MDRLADMARRQAMALLGGVAMAPAALAAAPPTRGGGARVPLDLATQAGRNRAYFMMRGALDGQLVIGCLTGRYYGVVDAEITPLFGLSAATLARFRPTPDGGREVVTREFAFFTDLAGEKALDRLVNPYTGETVDVPTVSSAPAKVHILPNLDLSREMAVPGLVFEHHVLPPEARGDDVWFTEVTRSSVTMPGGKPLRYSESITLHARRSDLERPGAVRATTNLSYTNVVGWRPWLKMGDRPGNLMAIGAGRHAVTPAELPASWIEGMRLHYPAVLADLGAALEPLWSAR